MHIKLNIAKQFTIPFISINTAEQTPEINSVFESIQMINNTWQLKGTKSDRITTIYLYQVVSFHTDGKYVICQTWDDSYRIDKRIYELAKELPAKLFIQISSSEIVAISCIKAFGLTKTGSYKVYLKNDTTTYTSRRYVKKIKEELLHDKNN